MGGDGSAESLIFRISIMKAKLYVLGGCTAVRVGQTQSNMSAPNATETTRSSGYPYEIILLEGIYTACREQLTTPITYLGFPSGSSPVQVSTL